MFPAIRPAASLALLLSLTAGAAPAAANGSCPDILLGDSLAIGMGVHARTQGFQVIAKQGAGIAWLRQQPPRCARRLVLVFGTNDIRGMTPRQAEDYITRINDIMERWSVQQQMIWATPGCFPNNSALDAGSNALDQVLASPQTRSSFRLRELPAVNSGRQMRCAFASPDGIHPNGSVYRSWWTALLSALNGNRLAARF